MQGKLKVKGNLMMAMRLDTVLKTAPADTKNALQGGAAPAAPAAAAPAGGAAIQAPGFLSSSVFSQIKAGLDSSPAKEREGIVQKTKAIYQFDLKNGEGKTQSFTLDLKNGKGDAYLGPSKSKADVTMILADKDFVDLSQGKLNGQKAFMSGKLKVRGQIMLATKLDGVLKSMQKKPKL
ncbi:SCP2 sterol-binding domain-containing protein [Paraphysoderma sedebokerense]|nr:SCP2 sterol-binding domain-containing protein [Paraphysoderma sedebokerense]